MTLQCLETKLNHNLYNINERVCADKLSLNIEKSNFVILIPLKKVKHSINLKINDKTLEKWGALNIEVL